MLEDFSIVEIAAACTIAGSFLGSFTTWLFGMRKDGRAAILAAMAAQAETLATYRIELDRIRTELREETVARKAAEEKVYMLRDGLHILSNYMHRSGLTPPSIPGWTSEHGPYSNADKPAGGLNG